MASLKDKRESRKPQPPQAVQPSYEDVGPSSTQWTQDARNHVLRIHLPGFDKEDLRVQMDGSGKLTVKGLKQVSKDNYRRLQESYDMPKDSEFENTTGKFEDGFLTLSVPKKVVALYEKKKKEGTMQDGKTIEDTQPSDEKSKLRNKEASDYMPSYIENKDRPTKGHEHHNALHDIAAVVDRKGQTDWSNKEGNKWIHHEMKSNILDKINKNKKVIAVAIIAFSVGFYVSHKLRSSGM